MFCLYFPVPCVCNFCGGQKRMSDPLELEREMATRHRVAVGGELRCSARGWVLLSTELSLQPPNIIFCIFPPVFPGSVNCTPNTRNSTFILQTEPQASLPVHSQGLAELVVCNVAWGKEGRQKQPGPLALGNFCAESSVISGWPLPRE